MLQLERMGYMNSLIAFLPFVFFNEEKTLNYLLCFSLTFDFLIYDTFLLNTLFFMILYIINRRLKLKFNYLNYAIWLM